MVVSDIDAVLARLDEVIDETKRDSSRAGYFAAMYHKVTFAVKEAIVAGRFADNDRVARLDCVFAERYLDAYARWRNEGRPTAAWQAAFDANERWRPTIVQQLLVGMNAHINLDLGIAAATVAPGAEIDGLRADFNMINDVLAELIDGIMEDVGRVSPWMGLLDRFGGRTDQAVVRFSIEVARRQAWALAVKLAATPGEEWDPIIAERDKVTTNLAGTILSPGPFLPIGLLVIRLRESNDIQRVIEVLAG